MDRKRPDTPQFHAQRATRRRIPPCEPARAPRSPRGPNGLDHHGPEDTSPMSGSNSICVSTVLLDSGIIPMTEPITEMTLEAPGGLVRVRAECCNGKAVRITVRNLPSFAGQLGLPLDVKGIGQVTVDTAFGGDSFVVVDAAALGFELVASEAKALADLGVAITNAANAQLTFHHPDYPDWRHFSFCLFAGPITREGNHLTTSAAVAIQPGKIDRYLSHSVSFHSRENIAPSKPGITQAFGPAHRVCDGLAFWLSAALRVDPAYRDPRHGRPALPRVVESC